MSDTQSAVPKPQTSIDTYQEPEVAVRFRRWTAFEGTAYQRGQHAGFARAQIAELERRGIVDIVHVREPAVNKMVRKGV